MRNVLNLSGEDIEAQRILRAASRIPRADTRRRGRASPAPDHAARAPFSPMSPTAGSPALVRFTNVVGHFSTLAVAIVQPQTAPPPGGTPPPGKKPKCKKGFKLKKIKRKGKGANPGGSGEQVGGRELKGLGFPEERNRS